MSRNVPESVEPCRCRRMHADVRKSLEDLYRAAGDLLKCRRGGKCSEDDVRRHLSNLALVLGCPDPLDDGFFERRIERGTPTPPLPFLTSAEVAESDLDPDLASLIFSFRPQTERRSVYEGGAES